MSKLYHPSNWGEDYYLEVETGIAFKKTDDGYKEVPYVNTPPNWVPRVIESLTEDKE